MAIEDRNGTWHIRGQVAGRKYHMTTGLKSRERNRKKAEALDLKTREDLSLARRFDQKPVERRMFAEAAGEFRFWMEAEHGAVTNTIEAYRAGLNHCIRFFGDEMITSISPGDVDNFKASRLRESRPTTTGMSLMVLNKFFKYAKRQRWCSEIPTDGMTYPNCRDSVRTRCLSADLEVRYLEAIGDDQDLRDFVLVLINQGVRPNEALHLRKEDVDIDAGNFRIVKGKTPSARRLLTMTGEARDVFQSRLAGPSLWVFPCPEDPSRPIPLNRLEHRHANIRIATGLDLIFYDCRHTFATRMLEAGVSEIVVARILGHADLSTIHKYLHPGDKVAVEAMLIYEKSRRLKLAS